MITWPITSTGGVNEVVLALARELEKRGWHPIIAVASWSRQKDVETWRGVQVTDLQLRDLSPLGFNPKQSARFCPRRYPMHWH